MTITRRMLEENEMDGYAKIDQYNPVAIRRIAEKYRAILKDIGEDPGQGCLNDGAAYMMARKILEGGKMLTPAQVADESFNLKSLL